MSAKCQAELKYYHRPEPPKGEDFIVSACNDHASLLRAFGFSDGAGDLAADLAAFNGEPGGCAFGDGKREAMLRELRRCTCHVRLPCPVHPGGEA